MLRVLRELKVMDEQGLEQPVVEVQTFRRTADGLEVPASEPTLMTPDGRRLDPIDGLGEFRIEPQGIRVRLIEATEK